MYIKPQEYILELEKRITELKTELSQIEPIYESLIKTIDVIPENKTSEKHDFQRSSQLTPAEKIAEAQKKRHRRERDKKVPYIVSFLEKSRGASIKKISETVKITAEATKKILKENSDKFCQNPHNKLWELKTEK